ncbi:putative ACR [uncultured archaeon]|nr:putative ACR [uncultured archaeon]
MVPVLRSNSFEIAKNIEICRTLTSQTLGLMFRSQIPDNYAMIFVMKKPSSAGIHMLFMRFPIDVIFLDEEKTIIGLAHLKPWTGHKAMKKIKYIIETNPGAIEKYKLSIGGKMEFEGI